MYSEIKEAGRFVRGLVSSGYRRDCYYGQFSEEWRELHKNSLEGMEVEARVHHNRAEIDDCSLDNWILGFGKFKFREKNWFKGKLTD
jgi:hypothetical protein